MIRFDRHPMTKFVALLLCFLLLGGSLPSHNRESRLQGPFNWAKKHYLEGKYGETARKLELLLTYMTDEDRELNGRIYLLLGAAKEKMGKIEEARKYYLEAKKMVGKQVTAIEEIDFSDLVEYQRIIMDNTGPLMQRVIEREAHRPKKKKISPLLVIACVAVVAGIVAFLLLRKEKPSEDDSTRPVDPDYDTRELGIHWVRIPAGEFIMGDNFNEGDDNERPVHPVYLDEYHISRYEITYEQFDKYCQETSRSLPSDEGWGRGSRPVVMVTWDLASAFCNWLSLKTGKDIHLPTEAQWEKAARGTDQRRYPWGNTEPNCSLANYCCKDRTDPVGSHPSGVSPYGVHNMAGNVTEWCSDCYESAFYHYSPYRNPQGPTSYVYCASRVVRGGSWNCDSDITARSADRGERIHEVTYVYPIVVYNDVGFRIVMEAD
jgi:formylglycine-generating enzyme required for sulfatase activity